MMMEFLIIFFTQIIREHSDSYQINNEIVKHLEFSLECKLTRPRKC